MENLPKEWQEIAEEILRKDAIYELHREHGKIVAIRIRREKKAYVI